MQISKTTGISATCYSSLQNIYKSSVWIWAEVLLRIELNNFIIQFILTYTEKYVYPF